MIEEQTICYDTTGIPLPEDQPTPLHSYLIHLQQQVDSLTQIVAVLVTRLCSWPAPAQSVTPPPPASSTPSPIHRYAVTVEHYDLDGCCHFVLACELYFLGSPEMKLAQKVAILTQGLMEWDFTWTRGGPAVNDFSL